MISRRRLTATVAAYALCAGTSTAFAATGGPTKKAAQVLSAATAAHIHQVGLEQADRDFAADRATWMPKDLYPFVMSFEVAMRSLLSDRLINMHMNDVKHTSGKAFGKEMLAAAKSPKASGRVDYGGVFPAMKRVEDKASYLVRAPGAEMFVGGGVYR